MRSGDIITENLNQALAAQGDNVLVNLASDEYFKAVKPEKLDAVIIKPVFLDEKNGKYKVISFYAKKSARPDEPVYYSEPPDTAVSS